MNSAISSDRRFRRELAARRTEHVHDDQRRQRAGELGDEVEFLPRADLAQQPRGQRLDVPGAAHASSAR
jgi:hypothetical protein